MKKGTPVLLTADGPMGTLDRIAGNRMADEVVNKGEVGRYWSTHPDLPDWHMIEFEVGGKTRYCPLHAGAFTAFDKPA